MMKKICINCGNLHNGGGVQVASSFITELLTNIDLSGLDLHVNLSDEVLANIDSLKHKLDVFNSVSNINTYGLTTFKKNIRNYFKKFDIIFTVFGPDYLVGLSAFKITGFAQPWIIYPNNEAYNLLSYQSRVKRKIKFYFQRKFFSLSQHIIVEIEHVKSRLAALPEFEKMPIDVVHNSLSSIYFNPKQWTEGPEIIQAGEFSIGFLGRDYPHKNTNIIPKIKNILSKKYNKDVTFFVTFTEDEWQAKSDQFKLLVNNVGLLQVSQCPSFYKKMDAIIFPSFLECFSAAPLEAMYMKKPLFASDRKFIHDICNDYAFYFDPLDADSAASNIYKYIEHITLNDDQRLNHARDHSSSFSNPTERAEKYLSIIRAVK